MKRVDPTKNPKLYKFLLVTIMVLKICIAISCGVFIIALAIGMVKACDEKESADEYSIEESIESEKKQEKELLKALSVAYGNSAAQVDLVADTSTVTSISEDIEYYYVGEGYDMTSYEVKGINFFPYPYEFKLTHVTTNNRNNFTLRVKDDGTLLMNGTFVTVASVPIVDYVRLKEGSYTFTCQGLPSGFWLMLSYHDLITGEALGNYAGIMGYDGNSAELPPVVKFNISADIYEKYYFTIRLVTPARESSPLTISSLTLYPALFGGNDYYTYTLPVGLMVERSSGKYFDSYYNSGFEAGYDYGKSDGYDKGKDEGYSEGLLDGANAVNYGFWANCVVSTSFVYEGKSERVIYDFNGSDLLSGEGIDLTYIYNTLYSDYGNDYDKISDVKFSIIFDSKPVSSDLLKKETEGYYPICTNMYNLGFIVTPLAEVRDVDGKSHDMQIVDVFETDMLNVFALYFDYSFEQYPDGFDLLLLYNFVLPSIDYYKGLKFFTFGSYYYTGYEVGFNAGLSTFNPDSYYEKGYNEGYIKGEKTGYQNGYSASGQGGFKWLIISVQEFLDTKFFGDFGIGELLYVFVGMTFALMFLKFFAGG